MGCDKELQEINQTSTVLSFMQSTEKVSLKFIIKAWIIRFSDLIIIFILFYLFSFPQVFSSTILIEISIIHDRRHLKFPPNLKQKPFHYDTSYVRIKCSCNERFPFN